MTVTFNLCIPNRVVQQVCVGLGQKISIINRLNIFSLGNKILFISKGTILPYKKTIKDCNLSNGDYIFGLKINENDSYLLETLNNNDTIHLSKIRNQINLFGPVYEANLTSINKLITISYTPETFYQKISISFKEATKEIGRLRDLKLMKKEIPCRHSRNRLFSFMKPESIRGNYFLLTKIDYELPNGPSTEKLPVPY
ncbi:hypothetical protein M9Y10_023822 [Tritrichomonas musculus]|uniref:Uncharacterized protein n=1 Tax=Tritrichomonas musculus TaxID=1915356 RepID=A0ABR2KW69_9EUKA